MNQHIETLRGVLWEKQRSFDMLPEKFKKNSPVKDQIAALAAAIADMERMEWLAQRCYLPDDPPREEEEPVYAVVSNRISPPSSFTCNSDNDARAFREAISAAMKGGE